MPVHGFARDLPWRVIDQQQSEAETSITLELVDNESTRKRYPFGFTFRIRYALSGSTLSVRHHVRAARGNAGAMPFSQGNHIAFALPASGATLTTPTTRRLLLDAQARPTGRSEPVAPLVRTELASFRTGPSVPLAGYGKRPWARFDFSDGVSIEVNHRESIQPDGDPVQFNMWGDPEKGFFSPEPW
jgi:galactose mutarotase-like enzyme